MDRRIGIKTPLSISEAERLLRCPGSLRVAGLVPVRKATSGQIAGRKLHEEVYSFIKGEIDEKKLEPTTRRIAEQLSSILRAQKHSWQQLSIERHLLIYDGKKAPLWHGYADLVAEGKGVALLFDLKSGRAVDARRNLQLRLYACALLQQKKKKVTAYIVSPFGTDAVQYDRTDLDWVLEEGKQIAKAALRKNAARKPGLVQCGMCPAAGTPHCPESLSEISTFEKLAIRDRKEITPARMAQLLETWYLVEKYGKGIVEYAKTFLAENNLREIRGQRWRFYLAKGRLTKRILSGRIAFQRLLDRLGEEKALECINISDKRAIELIAEHEGMSKTEAATAYYSLMADILETKEGQPILKREEITDGE
ncbi:MAG: hypothetical protein DRH04_01920 [Deltaproteobacteria bacterium]|nr:MAG: hypothetical protein DRH04_01920 [Deltaproteobacteria bacterium]